MKVDYIIVGLGLAGLVFVEKLIQAKKSFIVFEDDSQTSSLVAGGVYNPVILKRFSPVWNAKEQLSVALPFYDKLEKKFGQKFDQKFCIKKAFKSIEDQNKHPITGKFVEKTGMDCAKWLVEYCINNNLKFPDYEVHSMNVIGKMNIKSYIESFKSTIK